MKRHTVAAGLIAGIVVACSGPGLDAMGGMMRDSGDAMAGAGGRLAAAGRGMGGGTSGSGGKGMLADASVDAGKLMQDAGVMLADAGKTIADAGSGGGGGSDASAQESGDGLPRPHWVLRDKNGTPVKADVYPVFSWDQPKFTVHSYHCVSVNYFDQRPISLQYALATGKLQGCGESYNPSDTWRDSPYALFLDAACQGPAYYGSGPYIYQLRVGSEFYYTDAAPAILKATTYYHWNTSMAKCDAVNNASGQDLWLFKPVPSDVLNLLPNAPYTMELIY